MNDVILITSAVKDELERQRDDLYEFINDLNHFVQPTQEEQDIVRQLVNHPNFDKWGTSNKHYADPFVVALASCHHLIVVAYENPRTEKNSIPAACRLLNVEYLNFPEFLRREGISF